MISGCSSAVKRFADMDELLDEFSNSRTKAMTGVSHSTFRDVYGKYCGPLTDIPQPLHLFGADKTLKSRSGNWINGVVRYRNIRRNSLTVLLVGAADRDFVRVNPHLVRHAT